MSIINEAALIALIDSRIANASNNAAAQANVGTPLVAGTQLGAVGTPQTAADPFGGLGGTPAVQQTVTSDMIQQLIMPLIQNDAAKARLAAEMQAMGIVNLGDAQPHQLPELYQRFQRVAAEVNGGSIQQAQAQVPSGGII